MVKDMTKGSPMKLILGFAIPMLMGMLFQQFYNLVDTMIVGKTLGVDALAGVGATACINFMIIGFCMGVCNGFAIPVAQQFGAGKYSELRKYVYNGYICSIIFSVVLTVASVVGCRGILTLLRTPSNIYEHAYAYIVVIFAGIPTVFLYNMVSGVIRSLGDSKTPVYFLVVSAVINIILDFVFILVFKMGVEGAAIATVISQILTFIINICYIKKFKSVTLNKESFKIKASVARKVAMLGISSFITQMSIVVVMAFENNLLGKYGGQSKFGSEIPITVLGIVMKISQILNSIIIGIAAGAQPIIGYNYGAGKYDRVKKTLKTVLGLSVIISTIAFILFQTIPDKLISIFGSGDANYMEFACIAFRTYLMLVICNGIQIPSGIFFQAIGKGVKSAVLSLSRQIVLLIPAMFIFAHLFGVTGVLYAGPVADAIAFVMAVVLLTMQVKKFGKAKAIEGEKAAPEVTPISKLTTPIVITLSREYGSGGRYIGRLIADKLGIKLYDKEFVIKVAEETGLSEDYIEENEQKRGVLAALNNGYYSEFNNADELFAKESEIIKDIASKESCVIVGRCADRILEDKDNIFKVFVYSDMESKIKRATTYYGLNKEKAKKEIERIDKQRANHHKYYTGKEWRDLSNYDICVNSDALGVERTADIICEMIKEREKVLA